MMYEKEIRNCLIIMSICFLYSGLYIILDNFYQTEFTGNIIELQYSHYNINLLSYNIFDNYFSYLENFLISISLIIGLLKMIELCVIMIKEDNLSKSIYIRKNIIVIKLKIKEMIECMKIKIKKIIKKTKQ